MGKHSSELPPAEDLDPPETGARRRRLTSPAVLGTAVAAVIALGVAAWAFSAPDPAAHVLLQPDTPPVTQPTATASATEGFGQVVPASATPSPTRASRSPAASRPPSPAGPAAAATAVSASYSMVTWPDAYKLEFVLTNPTSAAALWSVRLQVPPGARVDQVWDAVPTQESETVWQLRPPHYNPGPIAAGGEIKFGLIVRGGQTVVSCAVNGSPCLKA